MKNVEQFKGMKILVLGLAKSGYAATKLLHSFTGLLIKEFHDGFYFKN